MNEATLFCSSLIRSVRSTAGLGLPPSLYTTNNNESINRVLKEKMCYKKQEWPTFNSKMLELVLEQQGEYTKVICKCGEYELHENYEHLEISQTDWSQMNQEQRKAIIDKLFKQKIKDDVSVLSCENHSSEAFTTLSIDWTKANITYLQPSQVEELWSKAAKLLNTPGFVVCAARNDCARQVASVSATASCDGSIPPHFVYAKKTAGYGTEVRCDCPVYSSTPKVCQHSLAAADDIGILSDYLTFLRKTKAVGLILSTLISKELPKSAGQKGTSRRKGEPKGSKKLILKEVDPLSLNTTSAHAENVPPPESPSSSAPFTPAFSISSPNDSHTSNTCWSALPLSRPPMPLIQSNTPSPLFNQSYTSSPIFNQSYMSSPMFNQSYVSSPMLNQSYVSSPMLNQSYVSSPMLNQSYVSSPMLNHASHQLTFIVKFLEGSRIRSCYGCGSPIRKDTSCIPPPPHDLIISYRERHFFRDPHSHQMRLTANEENTYYHVMSSCLLQKHPAFQAYMLKVADSAMPNLSVIHRMHLKEQFNIDM